MRWWDLPKRGKVRVSPRMVEWFKESLNYVREILEQLQSQLYDAFELVLEEISVRRSSELSVASGSIVCVINSNLLLTSNRRTSWRQFGLWNYRLLVYY